MEASDALPCDTDELADYRAGYDAGWSDGRAAERAILALPPRRWWSRR